MRGNAGSHTNQVEAEEAQMQELYQCVLNKEPGQKAKKSFVTFNKISAKGATETSNPFISFRMEKLRPKEILRAHPYDIKLEEIARNGSPRKKDRKENGPQTYASCQK